MVYFHHNISCINRSTFSAPGDDVDNDAILPRFISYFEGEDDVYSNDLATIIFCKDDDDPDVVVPSIVSVIFPLPICSHFFGNNCIGIKDNNDNLQLIHYKFRLCD